MLKIINNFDQNQYIEYTILTNRGSIITVLPIIYRKTQTYNI